MQDKFLILLDDNVQEIKHQIEIPYLATHNTVSMLSADEYHPVAKNLLTLGDLTLLEIWYYWIMLVVRYMPKKFLECGKSPYAETVYTCPLENLKKMTAHEDVATNLYADICLTNRVLVQQNHYLIYMVDCTGTNLPEDVALRRNIVGALLYTANDFACLNVKLRIYLPTEVFKNDVSPSDQERVLPHSILVGV